MKMLYGMDRLFAGRGDDHVFLFNGLDCVVNGGSGDDTFEFRVFDDQTYDISRHGNVTTVIIDGFEYHQEITLRNFEHIVINEL